VEAVREELGVGAAALERRRMAATGAAHVELGSSFEGNDSRRGSQRWVA
jgi:hypothetical protein